MSRRPFTFAASALIIAIGVLSAGCGNSPKPAAISGRKVTALTTPGLPTSVLGLNVHPEDMSHQVQAVSLTYLQSSSLYSLRRDDVVQATLQISRFQDKAPYNEEKFRQAFLVQLSGTPPLEYRLGGQTVYQTAALRQRLAVWFKGPQVFVLSTRDEFDHPRDLIRAALALGQ